MGSKEKVEQSSEVNRIFFNPGVLTEWNNHDCRIESHGQDISVLILGETHYEPESDSAYREDLTSYYLFRKQIELIRLVKPEYLLHEGFKAWIYDPNQRICIKQTGRKFDFDKDASIPALPQELLSAAEEIGSKIIGCDLTYAECAEAAEKIYGHVPLLSRVETMEKVMQRRETHMFKTIAEYQKRSDRPIIAIIGADHGRNIYKSKLSRQNEFGYVYIDQVSWLEW